MALTKGPEPLPEVLVFEGAEAVVGEMWLDPAYVPELRNLPQEQRTHLDGQDATGEAVAARPSIPESGAPCDQAPHATHVNEVFELGS